MWACFLLLLVSLAGGGQAQRYEEEEEGGWKQQGRGRRKAVTRGHATVQVLLTPLLVPLLNVRCFARKHIQETEDRASEDRGRIGARAVNISELSRSLPERWV